MIFLEVGLLIPVIQRSTTVKFVRLVAPAKHPTLLIWLDRSTKRNWNNSKRWVYYVPLLFFSSLCYSVFPLVSFAFGDANWDFLRFLINLPLSSLLFLPLDSPRMSQQVPPTTVKIVISPAVVVQLMKII